MARKRAQLTENIAQDTLNAGGILKRITDKQIVISLEEIPIGQIQPNPFQPRQHFAPESVEELSKSIKAHGFYGHLLVRKKGRSYQLAYGERRLRAAKLAKLDALPVQVRDLSDQQMLEIALTENVLREDLHPVEEARAYVRLQGEMGYSIREIAKRIGRSSSYVGTILSIVRYPDLEEAVRTADIPVRTAEELAKIEDADKRRYYIQQVVAGRMDRGKLVSEREQKYPGPTVRTADTRRTITSAINSAYRTLERQKIEQIAAEEKAQTILLLQQIITQAQHLLEELEEK